MDAILLAGGYGTRLYPLTLDRPKALLPVGGRPILDHIVDALEASDEIRRMFLVTNTRFAGHFKRWADGRRPGKPIEVFDDGTESNETRLGAIGDVRFVLNEAGVRADEGLYVLGTDNMARFDVTEIIPFARSHGASAIFASRLEDRRRLTRMGVVTLDESGRVVEFEEKPKHPKSDLAVPPFYVYSPEAAPLVHLYLEEGNNPDAPGHFIAWLAHRSPVYALVIEEVVRDIGTLESYRAICREFEGRSEGRGFV